MLFRSLANDPNGLFAISGNQLVVATGVTLDINAVASDTIAMSVTDAAGASLVQIYTGLVYGGPALPARILRDMDMLMRRDGFARLADAIGSA